MYILQHTIAKSKMFTFYFTYDNVFINFHLILRNGISPFPLLGNGLKSRKSEKSELAICRAFEGSLFPLFPLFLTKFLRIFLPLVVRIRNYICTCNLLMFECVCLVRGHSTVRGGVFSGVCPA